MSKLKVGNSEVGNLEVGNFEVGNFEVSNFEVGNFEVHNFLVGNLAKKGLFRNGLKHLPGRLFEVVTGRFSVPNASRVRVSLSQSVSVYCCQRSFLTGCV